MLENPNVQVDCNGICQIAPGRSQAADHRWDGAGNHWLARVRNQLINQSGPNLVVIMSIVHKQASVRRH